MLEANSSVFISSGKMSPYMPCLEILFNCVERIPCILSSVRRPLAIETRFLGLGPHIRAASTSAFGFSGVISSLSLCKNYLDEYDDEDDELGVDERTRLRDARHANGRGSHSGSNSPAPAPGRGVH